MAPTDPLPVRVAQTLGLSTSLILSGFNLTLTTFLVPRILESPPPLLLQQWLHAFDAGKVAAPPIALLSTLSYLFLAYNAYTEGDLGSSGSWSWKVGSHISSAVLVGGIVPYTLILMGKTNGKLIAKAKAVGVQGTGKEGVEVDVKGEETAHSLVDWWGVLNLGRGVMVAAGGVLGIWTVLN